MTIPSTGPLRPVTAELGTSRERWTPTLVGLVCVQTAAIVVLVLVLMTADRPVTDVQSVVLGVIGVASLGCLADAVRRLLPGPLPPIEQTPTMPTAGPPGRASVSPEPPPSWPFGSR